MRQQHIVMQQHIIMVTHIEQQSCVWHIIIVRIIIGRRTGALSDLRGARNDDMMSENAMWGRGNRGKIMS